MRSFAPAFGSRNLAFSVLGVSTEVARLALLAVIVVGSAVAATAVGSVEGAGGGVIVKA